MLPFSRSGLLFLVFFLFLKLRVDGAKKVDFQHQDEIEEEEDEEAEGSDGPHGKDVYSFLASRMKQDLGMKKRLPALPYRIPGPQEPLPGRSHLGDYFPVFPFHNQYSGAVDLDPSVSRHIGGDMNIAVPSYGMIDWYGRLYTRIHDTTTKFGYINHPVNMLDLEKEDFVKLMGDPAMAHNRKAHPTLPMATLPRNYVPMSCKPPMCNPYHMNFGLGIEHDYGGADGFDGDIDVQMPVSKGIAYRLPLSGNLYYNYDNITVTYGQNLAPIDPFASLFDYQKNRDPALGIPRRWTRSVNEMESPGYLRERQQNYDRIPFEMAMMPVLNTPPIYSSLRETYPRRAVRMVPLPYPNSMIHPMLQRRRRRRRVPMYYIPNNYANYMNSNNNNNNNNHYYLINSL